jgi:putative flippase GtrA
VFGKEAVNAGAPSGTLEKRRFKVIAELITTTKFAVIGLVATAVHVSVVWGLITYGDAPPFLGNTIAFLTAFCFSFSGHYWWTFQNPGNRSRAFWRFLAVSVIGFLSNNALLGVLIAAGLMPVARASVVAALVIPVISYLSGRLWAFSKG